jgi:hypothetical protein
MTINPNAEGFMIPQPDPPIIGIDCEKRTPPERHDMPEQWDYTHNPGGRKVCRKCRHVWYD